MFNIDLQTNDDEKRLTLKSVTKHRGDGAYSCKIVVNSFDFSCTSHFSFSESCLAEAIENLEYMYKNLQGEAVIGEEYEESRIRIAAGRRGLIAVEGLVVRDVLGSSQSLKFSFQTDQTVLQPFITSLKKIRDISPASLTGS